MSFARLTARRQRLRAAANFQVEGLERREVVRVWRAAVEALEDRRLLSGSSYTMSQVGYFGVNDTGANPRCTLVADPAGDLFGTTHTGGAYGAGTVFEIPAGGGAIVTLASFNGADGVGPIAGITPDLAGNLYGVTSGGGAGNDGTVFEIAKGSRTIVTLASFNGANGKYPDARVTLDPAGNLYGTTEASATSIFFGTVFEIAAGSNTITTLATFNNSNGASPQSGVMVDSADNLYGTAGDPRAGPYTVFEIAAGSNTITTLASFTPSYFTGLYPDPGVTLDAAGNLYGTTEAGGASNEGMVFEIARGSNTVTPVASFNGTNGEFPEAGVTLDSTGNLYGTTNFGGGNGFGTVFEIAAGSGTATALVSFPSTNGQTPRSLPLLDSAGNLYGTTCEGGTNNAGSVFEIANQTNSITTLASFNAVTGGTKPNSSVTLDSAGNLFGTTSSGGADGYGTVFEIPAGSNTVTTLASFNGANGQGPDGVTLDSAGNLYGTTSGGGGSSEGTLFEIVKGSNAVTTLATFDFSTNGSEPAGNVALDSAGNLYGTTVYGGPSDDGTVFEFARGATHATTLASFNGGNGQGPNGVTIDSNGNLYGTTLFGGAGGGTVFEFARGSFGITPLASLNGGSYGGVTLDSAGNLYGTTYQGGANSDGSVFEVAAGSHTVTTLASFNGADGANPSAGVTIDAAGNLYGTTSGVAAGIEGTVFELTRGSAVITTLVSFNGRNGGQSQAGLALDSAGNLYGTTSSGGASNYGVVFQLAPTPITDAVNGGGDDAITIRMDTSGTGIDWMMGSTGGLLPINDPNGLTINGNGGNDTITLDYTNGNPLPNILHLNGTFTITGLEGTNPLAGTTMDIGRSTLLISYNGSDPLAAIQGYLHNGYNAGAWNGSPTATTGVITSAAAQANANHNTAIGYADFADGQGVNTMPNTIELTYTLYGDANLDHQVNSADLQILLAFLNRTGAWDQGDFNYDGQVNSADLQNLLFTLNTSLGSQAMPMAVVAAPVAATTTSAPSAAGDPSSQLMPAINATGSTTTPIHHPHPAKISARKRR